MSNTRDGAIHVIPFDDTIEHYPDGSCCNPFTDDAGVVVHHSKDMREVYERNGKIGKGWKTMRADMPRNGFFEIEPERD